MITIGSQWLNKSCWGDVDEHYETPDNEKKVIRTVQYLTVYDVYYTIKYDGNPDPKKIHSSPRKDFMNDLKLKEHKFKSLEDYKIGEVCIVWMNTDTDRIHEWRTAKVVDIKHVEASRNMSGRSHPAYSYLMIDVIRTYCKEENDKLVFYDKLNTEGWLNSSQIRFVGLV